MENNQNDRKRKRREKLTRTIREVNLRDQRIKEALERRKGEPAKVGDIYQLHPDLVKAMEERFDKPIIEREGETVSEGAFESPSYLSMQVEWCVLGRSPHDPRLLLLIPASLECGDLIGYWDERVEASDDVRPTVLRGNCSVFVTDEDLGERTGWVSMEAIRSIRSQMSAGIDGRSSPLSDEEKRKRDGVSEDVHYEHFQEFLRRLVAFIDDWRDEQARRT
jgi:hypothetical protein